MTMDPQEEIRALHKMVEILGAALDAAEAEKRAAVAAAYEKAEKAIRMAAPHFGPEGPDNQFDYDYGEGMHRAEKIVSALSDTDALAEYAEKVRAGAIEMARQAVWDALNGSQEAERLCDAIDAAAIREDK